MRPIDHLEREFYDNLSSKLTMAKYYTDAVLLQHAYHFIPFKELKVKATIKFSEVYDERPEVYDEATEGGIEDFILLELLHWFKHSFFTWMDAPKCTSCNKTADNRGTLPPTAIEAMSAASRVEHFVCPKCQMTFRFPRYNDPKKLLQTRTGRCGEWANCFTLLCHALEYNTRIVFDWTDHVWTEVYSQSKNRWVHCDPCENVCDKPLMYEIGWRKKLSYIIAFSPTEVQDVTWRYTANFKDVMTRRIHCREEFLLDCIQSFQTNLEKQLDDDEKTTLHYRRLMELAEFLTPATQDSESYGGRSSGSLAWKLARGEIGNLPAQSAYTFRLSPQEIEQKRFTVKYSCATDKYIQFMGDTSESGSWATCVFSHNNIFRKVESDWKMVYLARTEGSSIGTVTWKFDFEDCGLIMSVLTLCLHSETFENGEVRWILYPNSDQNCPKVYSADSVKQLRTREFRGCTSFLLTAEVREGNGSNAWQHAQLFRQSLDSKTFPFHVEISFERKFYGTIRD